MGFGFSMLGGIFPLMFLLVFVIVIVIYFCGRYFKVFALTGRIAKCHDTQGVALG